MLLQGTAPKAMKDNKPDRAEGDEGQQARPRRRR
jgi:hypothetical protein